MKNHITKEAYFERLRTLGEVKKTSIKETNNRTLGTLIDYKRAADGVAYGIIKENHSYYIKRGGIKADPDVSDFAYVGGLANITDYQYKSLPEADKQRNMIMHTIGEAISLRPDKNGSKKRLNEDRAGEEIDNAENKLGDLDAATAAEEMPVDYSGENDMDAGLEAEPNSGEEGMPAPEGGEETGGEEGLPAPEGGEEGMPAPEDGEEGLGGEPAPEGGDEMGGEEGMPSPEGGEKDEVHKLLEKAIGKITNTIRKTELTPPEVKSYVNSYLSAFKDKFPELEIEDRKEMANKILKVVPPEDVDNLGDSMPPEETGLEQEGMEEEGCNECGTFAKYAESRGYDSAESLMECGEEEVSNLISGYGNAHNDGQNDGDLEGVALVIKVISPEILNKLKGDYGHDDYAEKLSPYVESMNEATEEENVQKLNELFGGLKSLGKAAISGIGKGIGNAASSVGSAAKGAGQAISGAVKGAGQAIGGAAQQGVKAIGQAGQAISQTYNQGEVGGEIKKLEGLANSLGQQVAALNVRLKKAGQPEVPVQKILAGITNQLRAGKGANIAGTSAGSGIQREGVDTNYIETQPNLKEEEDLDTDTDNAIETPTKPKEYGFAPDSQTLGGGVMKPDGAPTTIKVVGGSGTSVDVNLNEAKRKLIKQIAEGVNEYMNEISTGLAANASDRANVNREISHSTDPILNRKLLHQGNNFDSYINPELVKYLQSQGVVESYRGGDRNIIIKVPAEQGDGTVNIFISKDNYHINNGNVNQIDRSMLGRLPNIIKRVQADLSGDKSRFNPASTQQPVQESTKPSQGLSKDKKSEVVKKAKAGEDIGKKGKGFDKVANKAAKEYGSKEAGEKVAAAAMWKNIKKEGVEEEGKVVTESELKLRKYIRQHLEENAGLRKPTLNEDKKSETMKKLDAIIDKQFNLYESVVRNRK